MRRGYRSGGVLRPGRKNVVYSKSMQSAFSYAIIILMLIGVIVGALAANMTEGTSNESVKSYIIGFLSEFDKTGIDIKASFINSLYKYSRVIVIIWACGLCAPGAVVAVCIVLFKSFAYGYTTALLVRYFGFYGLVVGFNSYVPQNIFFLPAMFLALYNAFLMAYRKSGTNGTDAALSTEYVLILFAGLLCCAVAALIETYITPVLIEYIAPV